MKWDSWILQLTIPTSWNCFLLFWGQYVFIESFLSKRNGLKVIPKRELFFTQMFLLILKWNVHIASEWVNSRYVMLYVQTEPHFQSNLSQITPIRNSFNFKSNNAPTTRTSKFSLKLCWHDRFFHLNYNFLGLVFC